MFELIVKIFGVAGGESASGERLFFFRERIYFFDDTSVLSAAKKYIRSFFSVL